MQNIKIADMITKQMTLFLISAFYGIALGIWYEFFRAFRKNFVHKNRMVHFEDIIYCLTAAIGLFVLFQVYNQGSIRFYCLLGVESGAFLYFMILSAWVGKGLFSFIKISSKIVKKTGSIVFFPLKRMGKSIREILKNMQRTVKIIKRYK